LGATPLQRLRPAGVCGRKALAAARGSQRVHVVQRVSFSLLPRAVGTPRTMLDRCGRGLPAVALRTLPFERRGAACIVLRETAPAVPCCDRMHSFQRIALAHARAGWAPGTLLDGVRRRTPAMPLYALPFEVITPAYIGSGQAQAAPTGGKTVHILNGFRRGHLSTTALTRLGRHPRPRVLRRTTYCCRGGRCCDRQSCRDRRS
ncbi:hypothetical protein C7402_1664, partial [Paraburkholderia unamae]